MRKIFQVSRVIQISAFLAFILLSYDSPRAEMDILLETEKLLLGVASEDKEISQWKVSTAEPPDTGQWHSIVTLTNDGRPKSRHLGLDGIDVEKGSWEKIPGSNGLVFSGVSSDGSLAVEKKLIADQEYRLSLSIAIENVSEDVVFFPDGVRLIVGPGLGEYPVEGFGIAEKTYSYVEPVVSSEKTVVRVEIENDPASRLSSFAAIDWYGLHSRYFALLIYPMGHYANTPADLSFQYLPEDDAGGIPARYLPVLGINLNVGQLKPSQVVHRDFLVFSGPKSTAALKAEHVDFSGLLFSGIWKWMALLCMGLLWLLKTIHSFIPSWGLSIIVLAVLVRIAMYPIARRALSSQKAFADVQKKIQPEMLRIKKEYKGGEQSERILQLYEQHGVSPLAGLKPLLIVLVQLPIFIALFHVLGRAFELMSAPFLWIETLSSPDRTFNLGVNLPYFGEYFNVFPVLMAVTTLLTIKMSPAPAADKSSGMRQNVFLVLITITFFLLFYSFPSGMVLYWTMANVLHLLQQLIVERRGGAGQGL